MDRVWEVEVFPNPASETVNIAISNGEPGPVEIRLYSLLGEMPISKNIDMLGTTTGFEIDINNLPAGIYYLDVLSNGVGIVSQKLVKH